MYLLQIRMGQSYCGSRDRCSLLFWRNDCICQIFWLWSFNFQSIFDIVRFKFVLNYSRSIIQVIEKADQIMPLFVIDTVGNLPGLSGLFVAGVFSGALRYEIVDKEFSDFHILPFQIGPSLWYCSSLSSGLNSVALIVLEDFIRPFFPSIEDRTATKITKGVAILFGCINFGMVLLVAQVKTILDVRLKPIFLLNHKWMKWKFN